MPTVKRILYAVAFVAILLGVYGFYSRLVFGERDVNYGSYVNWGLWVAGYLFFAGAAAGSFMIATLDYVFEVPLFKGTGRYALLASLVTLPAALVLIGFDLGHMERIWKVYLEPSFDSLLAQLVWSYSLFLVVVVVSLVAIAAGRTRWLKPLMIVGLALAIFVSGGVGALLGANASRVSFHTAMLPAQFPLLNLASGAAIMLIIVGFLGVIDEPARRERLLRVLSLALAVLLLVKAYFLWIDHSQALYSQVPDAVAVAEQVLFGQYAWAFWILQVGLGIVLPLVILVRKETARNGVLAGAMGVLVLLGLAVGRTAIIFPALAIPELDGLAEAFTGPHLGYDYTPSVVEWSVVFGVLGLSAMAFLILADRLAMLRRSTEVIE
jgi:molybdopterin-containing oxidoreductase family membrane subunit